MAATRDRGRNLPLSVPRRAVIDLLHFAKQIPTIPVQRRMDLSRLVAARSNASTRIFTKAFALVAREFPELRRAYANYPFARLYEHPVSVASVAVEREFEGEHGLFYAYLRAPDELTLLNLDRELHQLKSAPVRETFAFLFRLQRVPRPLRRLGWWYLLNLRPARKAVYLGTYGVSSYAGLGAESLHPLSPVTCTLNYGIFEEHGHCPVRIIYDHRVMDGGTVARALVRLEEILNCEIANELQSPRATSADNIAA
jgi:hypothetical protein